VALGHTSSQATIDAGDCLFRRGDQGDALYVVKSGLMEALINEAGQSTRIVATFGPGEFFGEVALLLGEPRSATVQARVDSCLIVLARSDFEALLWENPQIALSIHRALSRRLLDTGSRHFSGKFHAKPFRPEGIGAPAAGVVAGATGRR